MKRIRIFMLKAINPVKKQNGNGILPVKRFGILPVAKYSATGKRAGDFMVYKYRKSEMWIFSL